MLTAEQLARVREVQSMALPDTCTIRTPTFSKDTVGGTKVSWSTASVDCRMSPLTGDERYSGDKKTAFVRCKLTVPYGTALTEKSEVVHNGITYRVLAVDAGESWQTALRADVERVL